MASNSRKELKRLCGVLRERADMLQALEPASIDAEGVAALADDLRLLAVEAEDAAGLSPMARRRAVWQGLQRTLVAAAILLIVLVMNAKVFHDHSILQAADYVKVIREIAPEGTDANYYAMLLQWGVAGAASLLLFLLALMVATLLEGLLRLVRFPWVDSIVFAILTLLCSGAGLWAYLLYIPLLKEKMLHLMG